MQGVVVGVHLARDILRADYRGSHVLRWQRAARIIRRSTDCIVPHRALIVVFASV
jgi:hypothetical protein